MREMRKEEGFKLYGTTLCILTDLVETNVLTKDECQKVFLGAMGTYFSGTVPDFSGDKKIMELLYKRLLDDNPKKIDRRSITSKENGKKGGRPKKVIVE